MPFWSGLCPLRQRRSGAAFGTRGQVNWSTVAPSGAAIGYSISGRSPASGGATLGGCGSHPSSSTGGSREHQFATPPIEFDLAASTGPRWTWDELMSQLAPGVLEGLGDAGVSYGPAAGSPALREAIAEMAGVSPAEVIAVTGASEALWLLLLVAAEPGANVVLPHPGYPAFDELARHLALEVRHYHLAAAAQYAVDVDELASRLDDRTAVVIVNTPHNPTGSVVAAELLAQLGDLVASHGAQLVVDEVYHPIYHGPSTPSAATLAGATTIGDLSKALCLSGLRTGWIVEHDRAPLRAVRGRPVLPDDQQLADRRGARCGGDPQPRHHHRPGTGSRRAEPSDARRLRRRACRAARLGAPDAAA